MPECFAVINIKRHSIPRHNYFRQVTNENYKKQGTQYRAMRYVSDGIVPPIMYVYIYIPHILLIVSWRFTIPLLGEIERQLVKALWLPLSVHI